MKGQFCETKLQIVLHSMVCACLTCLHKSESVKRGSGVAKSAMDFVAKITRDHDIVIMVFDNYQEIPLKMSPRDERNKNTATKSVLP